jgi:hypothetical protein
MMRRQLRPGSRLADEFDAAQERGEVATWRSKLERLPNLDPYLRRGAS